MNCPNCDYTNSDYAHRCIRCGTKLDQSEKVEIDQNKVNQNSLNMADGHEIGTTNFYEGTIINYGVEEERYGKLYKWFRALFMGIPYTMSKQKHHMQLMVDSYGSTPKCVDVLLWGQIKYGYIHNGNQLRVYGKECRNGSIIAKKVVNDTSSREGGKGTNVVMERGLSPILVRIVTGLLLFFILIFFSGLNDMGTSMGGGDIKNLFIILLLIYVGVLWVKRKIRKKFLGW